MQGIKGRPLPAGPASQRLTGRLGDLTINYHHLSGLANTLIAWT